MPEDSPGFDIATSKYPVRLAFQDKDGFPRIASLWYHFQDGELFCVTPAKSWLVQQLQKRPKVGFEIAANEPPYKGIRGTGIAKVCEIGDSPILEQLIDRYLGSSDSDLARFLLNRRDQEMIIQVSPVKQSSWDYSQRMKGAVAKR